MFTNCLIISYNTFTFVLVEINNKHKLWKQNMFTDKMLGKVGVASILKYHRHEIDDLVSRGYTFKRVSLSLIHI